MANIRKILKNTKLLMPYIFSDTNVCSPEENRFMQVMFLEIIFISVLTL